MMVAEEEDQAEGNTETPMPSHAEGGGGQEGSVEGETSKNSDVISCPERLVVKGNKETDEEDPAEVQVPSGCQVVFTGNQRSAKERLQRACLWGITKYKSTRQALSERLGRASRTVDQDLQTHILVLHDDRQRYDHVTRLAQTLAGQLTQLALTQRTLGDAFAELSFKSPELHTEFSVNGEAQRFLSRSGESLVVSLTRFSAEMDTLVNKTIQDTLLNVRQYEAARVEYDAYRCDLEQQIQAPQGPRFQARLDQAQTSLQRHQEQYLQVRDDLQVKLKLLQENRVKVLQNQLVLLFSAVASWNSDSHLHLQQGGARLSVPSLEAPSWLEDS